MALDSLNVLRVVHSGPRPPPKKGISRDDKDFVPNFCIIRFLVLHNIVFFPKLLEGLGRFGRLVGIISTYPGTLRRCGNELWPKTLLGGILFTVYGIKTYTVYTRIEAVVTFSIVRLFLLVISPNRGVFLTRY